MDIPSLLLLRVDPENDNYPSDYNQVSDYNFQPDEFEDMCNGTCIGNNRKANGINLNADTGCST